MLLALTAAHAEPQSAKPSTAEDRAKAVEFARSLESDPLGKQAKEQRKWLMLWLIEVPDISVKLCGSLLGPLSDDKNYAAELTTQMAASGVAFMIASSTKASVTT